jgi:hypothetical protein
MKTTKALFALAAALLLPTLLPAQTQPKSKPASAGKTLKVKLNYTGSGVVDEKHKIYVLVCDADPFNAERLEDSVGKPAPKPEPKVAHILDRQGAAAKNVTLTFAKLANSPVYAVAFYDKAGSYNGHSDPSAGSPMGLYGTKPGQADPIKLVSRATQVQLSFDDSTKTP